MEPLLYLLIIGLLAAIIWLLWFRTEPPPKPTPRIRPTPPPRPAPPPEIIIVPVPVPSPPDKPPQPEPAPAPPQTALPPHPPLPGLKYCPRCGKNRQKSSFYHSQKTADGLTKWCVNGHLKVHHYGHLKVHHFKSGF